jgi:hypothetical protein
VQPADKKSKTLLDFLLNSCCFVNRILLPQFQPQAFPETRGSGIESFPASPAGGRRMLFMTFYGRGEYGFSFYP